jgi:hypothetical protein
MNDVDILDFNLVKLGTLGVEDELLHNVRVLRDIGRESSSNLAPVTAIFPDAGPWSHASA